MFFGHKLFKLLGFNKPTLIPNSIICELLSAGVDDFLFASLKKSSLLVLIFLYFLASLFRCSLLNFIMFRFSLLLLLKIIFTMHIIWSYIFVIIKILAGAVVTITAVIETKSKSELVLITFEINVVLLGALARCLLVFLSHWCYATTRAIIIYHIITSTMIEHQKIRTQHWKKILSSEKIWTHWFHRHRNVKCRLATLNNLRFLVITEKSVFTQAKILLLLLRLLCGWELIFY